MEYGPACMPTTSAFPPSTNSSQLSANAEQFGPFYVDINACASMERTAAYQTTVDHYYTAPGTTSSKAWPRHSAAITDHEAHSSSHKRVIVDEDAGGSSRQTVKSRKSRKSVSYLDLVAKEERLREQRRMCQMRYRKRKHDYGARLQQESVQLREEVSELEAQYRAKMSTAGSDRTVWSSAVAYFLLFRDGDQGTQSGPTLPSPELNTLMSPSVIFNNEHGVDSMARYWRRCSLWFGDVSLKLVKLEKGPTGDLEAITSTSVTFTARTLRNVFPQLLNDEGALEKVGFAPLAYKLMGQRVVMRGWTRFEWDASSHLVARVTSESDLLQPLLRLLGNLEDVSRVFEQALISPDFRWKSADR